MPNVLYIAFLTCNSFVIVQIVRELPEQAGFLIAVTSVAHAAAATQSGCITALFAQLWLLVGATVLMAAGLVVIGILPTPPIALLGGLGVGTGFGISFLLYRSVITGFTTNFRGVSSAQPRRGVDRRDSRPVTISVAVSTFSGSLRFGAAVRWTIVATGLLSNTVGMLCLAVVRASPPLVKITLLPPSIREA